MKIEDRIALLLGQTTIAAQVKNDASRRVTEQLYAVYSALNDALKTGTFEEGADGKIAAAAPGFLAWRDAQNKEKA